ncbi:2-keto-4-pentenoate hydratase [Persicitalea sp.]|uniref:2-keto-4-pentenoate hydratase n=1 Tax=Persicitalea sp. TaxID=3100273 RepID=UPI0035947295
MKTLESIAADFYHSFYKKEWKGEEYSVRNLSIQEAYEVQDLVAARRIKAGEQIAGFKVGCTSNSIRKQFGLSDPIYGRLFYPHVKHNQASVNWGDYINCAIEPELVIKIGKNLEGRDLSDKELIDAIDYVSPGIEIHEYNFWVNPPTIQELICSGGIHTGLIIGDQKVSPVGLQFKDEVFAVYKNESLITSAPSSEIMGGPMDSLRWLVNLLTGKGLVLEKGSLVIPGSPVELVNISQDTELKVIIDYVGSVSVNFEKKY